jgi:homocysteine S-methyltransferase
VERDDEGGPARGHDRLDPLADALADALADDAIIVLDGGLATLLEANGADLRDPLWSARLLVEDPEAIVRAHLEFFRAGARVATTASYQASFEGLAGRGIDRPAATELLRLSVRLADDARRMARDEMPPGEADTLLIAASIGPYGAILADGSEFRGRYGRTVEQLREFHRERMTILASAGTDVLACETIPELEEGVALAGLLAEHGVTGWLSFSCADGSRLRSGAPVEQAFAMADEAPGVRAVGVNCTAPRYVDELLARARGVTDKPLIAYPNSGEEWDAPRRAWTPALRGDGYPAIDVDRTSASRWLDEGARLVGGCCRVTPTMIAEVAAAVMARGHARGDSRGEARADPPGSQPQTGPARSLAPASTHQPS